MISIKLSLVGAQVDCNTNTSLPRTFSSSSTITSPSEKRPTEARPKGICKCCVTASASLGLALPVNTIKLSLDTCAPFFDQKHCGHTPKNMATTLCYLNLAEEVGIEPTNAGIKIR